LTDFSDKNKFEIYRIKNKYKITDLFTKNQIIIQSEKLKLADHYSIEFIVAIFTIVFSAILTLFGGYLFYKFNQVNDRTRDHKRSRKKLASENDELIAKTKQLELDVKDHEKYKVDEADYFALKQEL